jgi:hypothetical protein
MGCSTLPDSVGGAVTCPAGGWAAGWGGSGGVCVGGVAGEMAGTWAGAGAGGGVGTCEGTGAVDGGCAIIIEAPNNHNTIKNKTDNRKSLVPFVSKDIFLQSPVSATVLNDTRLLHKI